MTPTQSGRIVVTVTTIDDIDATWVERILHGAGFAGVWIDGCRVEPIASGVGLLSATARVTIAYGHNNVDAPRSLIVKAPSADSRARAIASQFGYYAREAGAYRLLRDLDRAEYRTPLCYAEVETDRGPLLVLQDLPHQPGDQVAGATREQALAAATTLAGFHTRFWNDASLRAAAWLPSPLDEVIAGYGRLFELTWPTFVNRFGNGLPREQLGAAERAITHFDRVIERFAEAPFTLVHGDFRLDNLLFEPHPLGDLEPLAHAIDWQLAARSRGAYDLAFFLAGSVTPNQRRLHERAIVERYHGYLQLGGVADYSLDDCWADYRLGLIANLPNPITALVAVPAGNERGRQLLQRNAERALAAITDHDRRGW